MFILCCTIDKPETTQESGHQILKAITVCYRIHLQWRKLSIVNCDYLWDLKSN